MVKVLIADDHHVVRRGLLFFLKTQKDIEVVGESVNGKEAVEMAMRDEITDCISVAGLLKAERVLATRQNK